MAHTLADLPYPHDALEPHIDARTMEIHHGKHHAAYVNNLNNALAGTGLEQKDLTDLLKDLSVVPEEKRTAVRNNGGGHYNHELFWSIMGPGKGGEPAGPLAEAIAALYGNLDHFKEQFAAAATTRFGSGWAWLGVTPEGDLAICSTANQDNPIMGEIAGTCLCTPILGLDVWEHAYYLNYQNRRPDYISAWWNLVNWDAVTARYEAAKG